jgi:hypothetical protein
VYTVRFRRAVYVLHAFQKKSPKGIKTDQRDIEMVERRLRLLEFLTDLDRDVEISIRKTDHHGNIVIRELEAA